MPNRRDRLVLLSSVADIIVVVPRTGGRNHRKTLQLLQLFYRKYSYVEAFSILQIVVYH